MLQEVIKSNRKMTLRGNWDGIHLASNRRADRTRRLSGRPRCYPRHHSLSLKRAVKNLLLKIRCNEVSPNNTRNLLKILAWDAF